MINFLQKISLPKIATTNPVAFWSAIFLHIALLVSLMFSEVTQWKNGNKPFVNPQTEKPVQKAITIDLSEIKKEKKRLIEAKIKRENNLKALKNAEKFAKLSRLAEQKKLEKLRQDNKKVVQKIKQAKRDKQTAEKKAKQAQKQQKILNEKVKLAQKRKNLLEKKATLAEKKKLLLEKKAALAKKAELKSQQKVAQAVKLKHLAEQEATAALKRKNTAERKAKQAQREKQNTDKQIKQAQLKKQQADRAAASALKVRRLEEKRAKVAKAKHKNLADKVKKAQLDKQDAERKAQRALDKKRLAEQKAQEANQQQKVALKAKKSAEVKAKRARNEQKLAEKLAKNAREKQRVSEREAKAIEIKKKNLEKLHQIVADKFAKEQDRRALTQELQDEEDALRLAEKENVLAQLTASYVNQIGARVRDNWRYKGAQDNWGCTVEILQNLKGEVESVHLSKCNIGEGSEQQRFKNSIERAVRKASPLPSAPDSSVFDNTIIFQFKVN
jgi:colicin import membrane protein